MEKELTYSECMDKFHKYCDLAREAEDEAERRELFKMADGWLVKSDSCSDYPKTYEDD